MLLDRTDLRHVLALAASLLLAGCATPPTAYREPDTRGGTDCSAANLAVFDRVWSLVNDKYFDAALHGVDWPSLRSRYRPEAAAARDEKELYGILNRMAAELHDRHVCAISPRQVHEQRQHHAIGFGFRERTLAASRTVTEVLRGSPAEAAGIRVGWRILAPNPIELDSLRYSEQAIHLSFLDEHDQPRALTLSPTLLPLDDVRTDARLVADGVLYLRFDEFTPESVSWLGRELQHHLAVPAVIIDLRENTGGASISLQRAARLFFAEGRRLGEVIDRSGKPQPLDTLPTFSAPYSGKVVVLVGETTASSAEIFARALQWHRRATLIGQRTAGSVVEAFTHRLPDGGHLKVSERDFVDPASQRLESHGVAPDVTAPCLTLADICAGRDLALETALRLLPGIGSTPGVQTR
ncbi:MAG: hypothetical protein KF715_16495 [Candidatus Didemnitutus sp.]|nr:hypothetical protein [Candidatus Didemnitutus sp.]